MNRLEDIVDYLNEKSQLESKLLELKSKQDLLLSEITTIKELEERLFFVNGQIDVLSKTPNKGLLKEISEFSDQLKQSYPNMTQFEILQIAAKLQHNRILSDAYVHNIPDALNSIVNKLP